MSRSGQRPSPDTVSGRRYDCARLFGLMRLAALLLCSLPAFAELPTPESHFGHAMGEDRRLVGWAEVVSYFYRLDEASDSLRVIDLGPSTEGRPLIVAVIAEPGTIAGLERYRTILNFLADPRETPPAAAETLFAEGKPAVAITCSIHSTEVASTLTAVQFAFNLLSRETPRSRAILENTILLLVPSLNPDGVDKVRTWYDRWLDGPHEGAPMTELYHTYLGHDNNRDWYIFTQAETRHVVKKLHNAWRPQIVYDVHQMGPNGARIFVPPWIDPIDSNIDALIAQQVNSFGTAMAVDLTARGRKGVLVNGIYDYFSPARHYQSYHGALRLLSESASARYATPVAVEPEELDRKGRNYDATASSWNFLEPWEGGTWRLRDIMEDQLIAFESVLYSAALRRTDLLRNFYRIGQRVIERGMGRAIVVPRVQHDPNAAIRLLQTLQFGDVEVERVAADPPEPGLSAVRRGDYVVRLDQPYGAFAKTLLERQRYPDLRAYPGGPPKPPYDATAHTLPLLMGVETFPAEEAFDLPTEPVPALAVEPGFVADSDDLSLSPRFGSGWIAVSRLLADGVPVHRDLSDGSFLVHADSAGSDLRLRLRALAAELGIDFEASEKAVRQHPRLRAPRVAVYAGHVPLVDEGWTRWLLDTYEVSYRSVGNEELAAGLAGEFDALILPDGRPEILAKGYSHQYGSGDSIVPPAFRGGLGERGASSIREFASSGGTVLAFNRAASYVARKLGLPVADSVESVSKNRFFGPGTLLNAEADRSHPLCFGMRAREAVWFEAGPVFRGKRRGTAGPRAVLTFARKDVLASGWLLGTNYVASQAAVLDVPLGVGRVVLFGIRPQYRGQSNATFKMVLNGLYLDAMQAPTPR